ncbi:uncharacterized protein KGF55_004412 [Candida pseudojiufengensis]|uniref:uncharacterized protein n=1 Tax=Candida pseudojiufengensis TaxID=497109 RepID=UPI00222439AE|nr:uncharacterized protein KGF55_004412 [Candida pseudojiufengensis]KAI5960842.1 hypothetical protein KGF55_004412 [Candida pseudojiufengensis]
MYDSFTSQVTVSDVALISKDSVETNGGGINCLPNEGKLNIWFSKIISIIDDSPYKTSRDIQEFNIMMYYYFNSILEIINIDDNKDRFVAFLSNNRMNCIIKIISSNISQQSFIFSDESFKQTYKLVQLILSLLNNFDILNDIKFVYELLDSLLNLLTLKMVAKKDSDVNTINNLVNKIIIELIPNSKVFEILKSHLSVSQLVKEMDYLFVNIMSLTKNYLKHKNEIDDDTEEFKILFRDVMVLFVNKNYHNLNKLNYTILKQQYRMIKNQSNLNLDDDNIASFDQQNSDFYQYNSPKIQDQNRGSRINQESPNHDQHEWIPSFLNQNNFENLSDFDIKIETKSRNPFKKLFQHKKSHWGWFHFHKKLNQ